MNPIAKLLVTGTSCLLVSCLLTATAMARQPRFRPNRPPTPTTRTTPAKSQPAESVDRVVVRWTSRASGDLKIPHFITARELAFEARIEALIDGHRQKTPYTGKHVRAAVQRHISETMLSLLPVSPKPTPKQVASYAEAARKIIAQRILEHAPDDLSEEKRRTYGIDKLHEAREAEGISRAELDALLRRRARAGWYLDKMVAPMLKPSELDLREAHKQGETPFTDAPFDKVKEALQRWYISARVATALDRYFRNVRSRVKVTLIGRPPRRAAKATARSRAKRRKKK